MMNVGIVGYGIYIPKYRIKIAEIASVWGKNSAEVEKSLGLTEKSVAGYDEDAVTLAYEASVASLKHAGVDPAKLGVCLIGSESHPYAVNPTSTIVGELLGIGNNYIASDLEFACKAATSAIIAVAGLIASDRVAYGLAVASDAAQARTHDILEYTAACAAGAYILGKKGPETIADLVDFTSYSSDTPDFWRRDGVRYPSHGGRFTGEPAYFAHVEGASKALLSKTGMKPKDFQFCVFHSPNGKFPKEVARRLGFTAQQLAPSIIVDQIGNPYSASSFLGLSRVLDIAREGDKIFLCSYGSGAGSDSFVFEVTKNIEKKRERAATFLQFMTDKQYISYTQYLRFERKI